LRGARLGQASNPGVRFSGYPDVAANLILKAVAAAEVDRPGELLAPERNPDSMPMIDVYAAAGTFGDAHALAKNLATELMTIEQVPDIPMFRKNTAAFVHELPSSGLSNVDGEST
jgi:hypothetical protein